MSNIAISVENLSKRYLIGELERYYTIRDSLTHILNYPLRLLNKKEIKEKEKEFIWALKDVSFEVKHGDIVGIIGRNGAGKSTLLKILSRITSPTEGVVKLNGRVGSLLEVGTGFHPELTGRENIFLNGSILGMSKKEIERKFDEIVDFSEIEKFLDTPIKRYSSGMYVRLAFAVAAHMEPEILVVDEVLAVGDIQFQKKCLGKMGDVAKEGRTVIFVSHNMGAVNTLCEKAILLNNGKVMDSGQSTAVINKYINSIDISTDSLEESKFELISNSKAQLLRASIRGDDGQKRDAFDVFDDIYIDVDYVINDPIESVALNLVVKLHADILFISFDSDDDPELLKIRKPGLYSAKVKLPSPLKSGKYVIDLSLGRLNIGGVDVRNNALRFNVEERTFDNSLRSYSSNRPGVMAAHLKWDTSIVERFE